MSLYKPKNSPYWHYDFVIKGLRFHGSTGTTEKARARNIEAKARGEAAEGAGGIRKRQYMTLNEAADRYFEEVAKHQTSHATTDYQLANLCRGLGKDTLLSDITDDEISEYVARRRAEVSDASVNRETQLLRRVFRRALKTWKRDVGEMPDWQALLLTEPAGRVRELTHDEQARLFTALRDDFKPFVAFCIATGVRLMNALRLTWSQVDYDAGAITFRIKSKRPGGDVHAVPMTREVMILLAEQRGRHPIYVFTYECKRSRGGRQRGERYPFSQSGWRREWARTLVAGGIEDFRFHDTRHTAATRLLRSSQNLKLVQELLGHSDIATTARYAHVTKNDLREAMEQVSRNSPEPQERTASNRLKDNG